MFRHSKFAMMEKTTSQSLPQASSAAFALGIVGIATTVITALSWAFGDSSHNAGSGSDWFNGSDSPAQTHAKALTTLSFGATTIALLTLAVVLGVVEMRRRGLSLQLVRATLLVAAVTTCATFVLVPIPPTRHAGVAVALASGVSLIVGRTRISRIRRNIRRAET
jgi:hypothetical protein